MPRLSKIGAAALAAFGWSSGSAGVTANYLVVAGGGGGGGGFGPGGGGAGGMRTGSIVLNPTLSYVVTVGSGGAGGPTGPTAGSSGSDSVFSTITSTGGGFGAVGSAGGSGGSGGGGGPNQSAAGGTGVAGQGNNGGAATSGAVAHGGGGGGGAGAVGGTGSTGTGGNGGAGLASSISGTSTTYAGGGGASGETVSAGTGGSGGGGNGVRGGTGQSGTANTGGGGGAGGGTSQNAGGKGGSGVVIISYAGAQQFGGGAVTSVGGNTIHTFNTSGTLSPITTLSASYLVVGGGGGGSFNTITGGGAGSGGTFSGSGLTIDPNSTYLVTVGAGGAKATNNAFGEKGTAGGISSFLSYVTTAPTYPVTGNSGTSGNGYAGGTYAGGGAGGGGGASAVGGNASSGQGGAGGAGITSSISGTSTQYAGGGSGGSDTSTQTAAVYNGGIGASNAANGVDAPANYGGGGGGGRSGYFSGGYYTASNGGSGVVIISYAGATQLMAGGTVTIAGGNVIHTFTSSGFLTPITLVNRSLRFRSSASARLTRTYTATGSAQRFTASMWVKRGILSSNQTLFGAQNTGAQTWDYFNFNSSNQLQLFMDPGTTPYNVITSSVFRDPAAWYHVVCAVDTTQATASNRVRIYVNGVEQPLGTNTIPQNYNLRFNVSGNTAGIATEVNYANITGPVRTLDGYLAEINWIDGTQLTPSSFGTVNSYGVWQPITYGGSYGTNGFYLPFTNNASTTTLGYDFSPQGNNWTTNNISLTAGATYDSMTDVPTLTSATAANYAVLNPISGSLGAATFSNGNLFSAVSSAGAYGGGKSTIGIAQSSGKWYFEVTATSFVNSGSVWMILGLTKDANLLTAFQGQTAGSLAYAMKYNTTGAQICNEGTAIRTDSGIQFAQGDVLQCAFDSATGKLWFGKNNAWFDASSGTTGNPSAGTNQTMTTTITDNLFPFTQGFSTGGATSTSINFGQQPFTYTPPSGFVALNTYNL